MSDEPSISWDSVDAPEMEYSVTRTPEQRLCIAVVEMALMDFFKQPSGLHRSQQGQDAREAEQFLLGATPEWRRMLDFYCDPIGIDSDVLVERFTKMSANPDEIRAARRRLWTKHNIARAEGIERRLAANGAG